MSLLSVVFWLGRAQLVEALDADNSALFVDALRHAARWTPRGRCGVSTGGCSSAPPTTAS